MRTRFVPFAILLITVPVALSTRRFAPWLPGPVAAYGGDTLWSFGLYQCLRLMAPRSRANRLAVAGLILSFLVEISQLYHAPWIDSLRATFLGGTILGSGFLWTDLVCYAAGTTGAYAVDRLFIRPRRRS